MRPVPLDMLPPELRGDTSNVVPLNMLPPELGGQPEESGFFRQLADVPVGVARGAVSGIRFIADAFGANNPVSQALRGSEDYLADLMSAQAKNDQQEISRIWQEAQDKGLGEQVLAGVRAFTVAPVDLISQAFGTIGVNVVGGLAANLGKLALTGTRMGLAGQRVAQGVTGATMGAGIAKGEIYDAVNSELLAAGASPERAEAAAMEAQRYGGKNMDQILAATGLGAVAATLGAESVIGRMIAGRGFAPTAGRIAGTAGMEFLTEAAQGTQEQLAQNLALQREGFDVPTTRGLGVAGTLEGLAGAGVGAGAAALSRAPVSGAPVPPEALPEELAPTEPPTAVEPDDFPFVPGQEPEAQVLAPEPVVQPPAPPTLVEPTEEPPPFDTRLPEEAAQPLPEPEYVQRTREDIERESQSIKELEAVKPKPTTSLYEFFAYRPKRDKDAGRDNRLDISEVFDISPDPSFNFIRKKGGKKISDFVSTKELNPWLRGDLQFFGTETAEELAEKESAAEEYIKERLRNQDYLTEETKLQLDTVGESLENLERELEEYETDEQKRQAIRDILAGIDEELEFEPPEGAPVEAPAPSPEGGVGEPAIEAGPQEPEVTQQPALDRFPRIDSFGSINIGPGRFTPKVIAEGRPLYRETNFDGVADFLRYDQQVDPSSVFVSDNPDIALGQGVNRGVMVEFRPNSVSGREVKKPGTGDLAGREYQTDAIAPNAIQKITFANPQDAYRMPFVARRRLSQEFDKSEGPNGEAVYTRKGMPAQEPTAEPQPLQISPEEQERQDLAGFESAINIQTSPFNARLASGRKTIMRPRPMSRPQIKILMELARDAIKLGMPSSLLRVVKSAGMVSSETAGSIAPKLGALMTGKQWGGATRAEKLSTLVHELGHVVDYDFQKEKLGKFADSSGWDAAHKELKAWYDSNPVKEHPLTYPFHKSFDRRTYGRRLESFAQAFSYYFTMPVELQANAPAAYSAIQSIVERIQNESQPATRAGEATPTTAPIEVREEGTRAGPEVQPPASQVGPSIGRVERGRDQAAVEAEDRRRADMERDLFRLTPEGQIAPPTGVQQDLFGATGDLAPQPPTARRRATPEQAELPLPDVDVYPMQKNIFNQPVEASWGRQDESKLDTFIQILQDKMVDVKRVQEQIRKSGKEITDRWNAYLKEELFHGRAAKKTKDFLLDELDPLMKEMNKRDVGMAEFEEYLHNRTAKERNELVAKRDPENFPDGGSGILTADAEAYLSGLDSKKRADFEALARMVDGITKRTRNLLVKSGHESPETIAGWEQSLPNYVPLNRAEADYELSNMGTGVGQGYGIRGGFARSVVGSERPVVNILANIAMQRERAIVRTEKMRVGQALYGLVLQNPNPGFWLAVDPEAQANPQDLEGLAQSLINMGFSPDSSEVINIMDLADAIMKQPTIRRLDSSTNAVVRRANLALVNSPYAMPVRINGKDKYVFFNPQDPIAQRMAKSLRNVDADQMDKVLGPIAKITRYFAAINTQYNPIFGVINFMRDFQAAALQLSNTPLAGKQKQVAEKTLPALRGIYADLRARRKGQTAEGEYAQLWQRFQDLGGQTGFRDQFSRSEERADALYSVMNPSAWTETTLGKIFTANGALKVPLETARRSVAKPIFDWLTDYNETMENAVRLAAFKTALESNRSKSLETLIKENEASGLKRSEAVSKAIADLVSGVGATKDSISAEQAASLAKNLTVNFNRKGLIGKQAGALYAFFNASVQGTARMARTIVRRENGKVVFTPTGKKIFYGGLLLGSAQAMLMAAAGFDEDEPPEFVKERNLIIPIGGGRYVSIPYPLGFNVIPTTGRIMTEWAMSGFKDTPRRIADITGAMLEMFNPVGNAGWSWQTFSPTIADPAVALFENRDWTGKPIAKQDFSSLDPTPGYTRARDTASWFSKNLSEFLNLASGGTKFQKGLFSPTPDQIDYLIGQLTGGVGRELMKAEQTATSLVTGEELPTYKIPLVGRFVGDTTGQAAVGNKFYANLTALNGHQREIQGRQKAGESVQDYLRENPEARLYKTADRIQRNVSKLRKRRTEMIEKGASKDQIKAIENQITVQMKRLNDEVDRLKD